MNRKDPKGRKGKGMREATIKNKGSRGFPTEMREAPLKSSYYFVCFHKIFCLGEADGPSNSYRNKKL